ncbi:MAG: histidine ammonia-lyase [Flavobacteriales bacterium]|nr:histidine ammonia-lyase [Flavobacteriales bacterium]|tara:strand:+ start:757 stop:2256 length:1500 start_codon:yes stop_codon:yes gene_type:complete
MDKFIIGEERLTISNIRNILFQNRKLRLSSNTKKIILDSRNFLNKKIQDSDIPIYGVNTGFGSLCNTKIADNDLESLQRNLVLSHACGTGDLVPKEIVKIMLLFKIEALIKGYSSVQLIAVERLIEMFNNNIIPLVYQQGSLGASGDLAPLAHMSLFLIGEGQVYHNDKVQDSNTVLKEMNWQPIKLQSKEGLALLNGTQFMSAYGIWSIIKSQKLSYLADMIGAISLEGFDGRGECFDELIHLLRPHKGQLKTAANIRDFLLDSNIQKKVKKHVQDPYSFRCIPQVHGATKDVIDHVLGIFLTEVNSVTDNPNVFTKEDKIISGGNFHGQPLAMAMDYLAIAIAELGSISERRTYHLISGQRDLPSFLVANPGLNSGMMIPQYTAASIVSQNKQLCTPASVDSIVSSNGQEDHVSMGANAATKLLRVVENTERILAIELFNSSQAIFFRKEKSSDFIENILEIYREEVPIVKQDRLLYGDIDKSVSFLQNLSVDDNLI